MANSLTAFLDYDIGSPALAGSSSGTYTLTGDGSDIWDTSDSFHGLFAQIVHTSKVSSPAGTPSGTIHSVASGGNLQMTINNAALGDIIELQAGATFSGSFTLPVKSGSSYLTIRTSSSSIPGLGQRISPSQASLLAKVQSTTANVPAFQTIAGAHHYNLVGLELINTTSQGDVLGLGDGSSSQNNSTVVPHHLIIDRCYIHGDATNGQKRGVALHSLSTWIINCYISDIKVAGQDNQAIFGSNGAGPFVIDNNYLEAAGENLMFGGADPYITNLVPSDITITRNTFYKPVPWRDLGWQVKNLLELKNAQRVTIDSNTFDYNWVGAQPGYAIVFTPRNQDGTAPWSVVQHITFTNNIVRHVSSVFNILGTDNEQTSQLTNDILIENNEFYDVSGTNWGGDGRLLLIQGGQLITFNHNTCINDGSSTIYCDSAPVTSFIFTNNIIPENSYGILGTNFAPGNSTIGHYFPSGIFLNNIIIGSSSGFPANNLYPADIAATGFVNYAGTNYRLATTSLGHGTALDLKDIGYAGFNATIIARVTSMSNTDANAKAGIMIRESSLAGAVHTILDLKPNNDLEFMTRAATSSTTSFLAGATQAPPTWLRLVCTGYTVVASVSATSSTWSTVGTQTINFSPASEPLIGLIVNSHNVAALNTAVFDSVSMILDPSLRLAMFKS